MTLLGLAAQVRRPTWLEIDPTGHRLFAVSEIGNKGECDGEVLSFAIEPGETPLRLLGRESTRGGGPTHLCLPIAADAVFAANFGGGQAARLAVNSDGGLEPATLSTAHSGCGPHPRQDQPHPHGVALSPDGGFLLVPDMGNDQLVVHALSGGDFAPSPAHICQFPPGTGPRLVAFGPDGARAYLLSELSAELFVLDWDKETGEPEIIGRMPLDRTEADGAPSAAALAISRDGRHLYVSNRRSATICTFAIDPVSAMPSLTGSIGSGGNRPWGIAMSRDERWLLVANQGSNAVAAFRRSPRDGALTRADGPALSIPTPTNIAFCVPRE
ncbi:6-phosphogluconolactonase [Novosphingobium sp. SG720]|nr:6-phosphogluconolactonase [Novosphingobium sp. SG720]